MTKSLLNPSVELLNDKEILALCDLELTVDEQTELSDLLALNREEALKQNQRRRLDKLMAIYRNGLIHKAQAWQVAVARGLKPPLG